MFRVLILAAIAALAVTASPAYAMGSGGMLPTESVSLGVKARPLEPSGGTAHRHSMLMRTIIEYDSGD
jgi:hypothetical protein